uniref:Uncharacterized protein n=1 Tax=Triticum urartu TaxID=4572 RepID=A0A8R7PZ58_TRIUA
MCCDGTCFVFDSDVAKRTIEPDRVSILQMWKIS